MIVFMELQQPMSRETMTNTDLENLIFLPFSSYFFFWIVSQVTGLEDSADYEFRVRGVNEAGVGMASMPSDPVTAKALEGIV